jgi:methylated-DNA-[protein]-cysteine S-methyltransferase
MNLYYDSFDTPAGVFSVAIDDSGAVRATAFGGLEVLQKYQADEHIWIRDTTRLCKARTQVQEYFIGRRKKFDLALAPQGTPFQMKVWNELLQIPYGETRTYGELATRLNSPGASRAVGGANGANPIGVIIPCHRVIGTNGKLTGFAFGTDIKRHLLNLETAASQPNLPGLAQ